MLSFPSVALAHSRRSIAEVIEKHSRPTPPAFDPAVLLQQLSDGPAPVILVVSLLALLATGLLVVTLVGMTRRGEEVELEDKPLSRAKEKQHDAENQAWLVENWGSI